MNQIIFEGLAGGNAHDRIWSFHKDQKSKLYIVPDIIPDIVPLIEALFDIVIINLRYGIIFFDIEKQTFNILPHIQIYPSLSLKVGPYIEYFLQYRTELYLISGLIFNFDRLCHPSAPDIEARECPPNPSAASPCCTHVPPAACGCPPNPSAAARTLWAALSRRFYIGYDIEYNICI
jgi:hypothetical protein